MKNYTTSKMQDFMLNHPNAFAAVIVIITVGFFAVIFGHMLLTEDKVPISNEQARQILSELYSDTADNTEKRMEENSDIAGSTMIQMPSFYFEFIEFTDDDSAYNTFINLYSQLREMCKEPNVSRNAYKNYIEIYFRYDGCFYILERVGNTVVYSYCTEGYEDEINRLFNAIGYADQMKDIDIFKEEQNAG